VPPYLLHLETWKAVWPLPVAALLLTLGMFILVRPQQDRADVAWLLAAFSLLGLVTGYLTGFSREPVVGAVLPAALSLIGGMAVFMIGKDASSRQAVSLSVFIFTLGLVLGTGWGAVMRETAEDYLNSEHYLKRRALAEDEIRQFREALGLPPTPSSIEKASGDH
jgi:lysylphosphatidylglycerol synthetase-like protein (DUF2156 family)